MFELLDELGLSYLDTDGTAVNKKDKLVPESLLRSYVKAVLRYEEFIKAELDFTAIPASYWEKYPRDRILQMYTQVAIQSDCEKLTSKRVVSRQRRKETEALKRKLDKLCQLLVLYAEGRPGLFDLTKLKAEAKACWVKVKKD